MKIYVASSWRNFLQPPLVSMLRAWKHEVYDFRDSEGFHWSEVYPGWDGDAIPTAEIKEGLERPEAIRGFNRDNEALEWCECLILCLPAGPSSHAEFGRVSKEKLTVVLLPYRDFIMPDLMWKFANLITDDTEELRNFLIHNMPT